MVFRTSAHRRTALSRGLDRGALQHGLSRRRRPRLFLRLPRHTAFLNRPAVEPYRPLLRASSASGSSLRVRDGASRVRPTAPGHCTPTYIPELFCLFGSPRVGAPDGPIFGATGVHRVDVSYSSSPSSALFCFAGNETNECDSRCRGASAFRFRGQPSVNVCLRCNLSNRIASRRHRPSANGPWFHNSTRAVGSTGLAAAFLPRDRVSNVVAVVGVWCRADGFQRLL